MVKGVEYVSEAHGVEYVKFAAVRCRIRASSVKGGESLWMIS